MNRLCIEGFQNIVLAIFYLFYVICDQHYSGDLSIEASLKEPTYDISIKAVKLKKLVQMYQVLQ